MKTQALATVAALFALTSSCLASEGRYDGGVETASLATASAVDFAHPKALDVRGNATETADSPSPGETILMAELLGTDRI
jgi:hypothetical protein